MIDLKEQKIINNHIEEIKKEFKNRTGLDLYALAYSSEEKKEPKLKTLYEVYKILRDDHNINIRKRTRRQPVMIAKQVFCKVARDLGYTYNKIGRFLGNDHSSIIHNYKAADSMLCIGDPKVTKVYTDLMKKLDAK